MALEGHQDLYIGLQIYKQKPALQTEGVKEKSFPGEGYKKKDATELNSEKYNVFGAWLLPGLNSNFKNKSVSYESPSFMEVRY